MTGTRSETGLTATTGALAGVAAVLLVVLGVVAVQQGLGSDEADPTSADPASSSGTTTTASASSSPSESPTATKEPQDDAWLEEAVRAAEDQYPAFVPAKVPAGWTIDSAVYDKDGRWRMELTSSSGQPVVLDQRDGDDLMPGVTDALGPDAEEAGSVNLRRWGTGRWTLYDGDGRVALAQELAHTAVVVSGDKGDAVRLTKQLLTAEMVVNVGDGSDG